jgi:hypothetical protein
MLRKVAAGRGKVFEDASKGCRRSGEGFEGASKGRRRSGEGFEDASKGCRRTIGNVLTNVRHAMKKQRLAMSDVRHATMGEHRSSLPKKLMTAVCLWKEIFRLYTRANTYCIYLCSSLSSNTGQSANANLTAMLWLLKFSTGLKTNLKYEIAPTGILFVSVRPQR